MEKINKPISGFAILLLCLALLALAAYFFISGSHQEEATQKKLLGEIVHAGICFSYQGPDDRQPKPVPRAYILREIFRHRKGKRSFMGESVLQVCPDFPAF